MKAKRRKCGVYKKGRRNWGQPAKRFTVRTPGEIVLDALKASIIPEHRGDFGPHCRIIRKPLDEEDNYEVINNTL